MTGMSLPVIPAPAGIPAKNCTDIIAAPTRPETPAFAGVAEL